MKVGDRVKYVKEFPSGLWEVHKVNVKAWPRLGSTHEVVDSLGGTMGVSCLINRVTEIPYTMWTDELDYDADEYFELIEETTDELRAQIAWHQTKIMELEAKLG